MPWNFARSRRAALTLGAGAALAGPARGQVAGFPSRPLRVFVPFSAGGSTDVMARLIGGAVSSRIGQPVVIENRTGGGGQVSLQALVQSAPDGHTLMAGSPGTHVYALALYRRPPVNPIEDLRHVTISGAAPLILVVNKDLPATDLDSFRALLAREPDQHNFGSSGVGSSAHIAAVYLLQQLGVRSQHIPFRGSSDAMPSLMAGRVSFMVDTIPFTLEHIRSGAVRALMVWMPERSPSLPAVPCAVELGRPEFQAATWTPWSVPKATPEPVVSFLYEQIDAAMRDETVSSRLLEMGNVLTPGMTPDRTQAFIEAEARKWLPIIRASGASAD
jgi:tripartite-type tricarboxylate transporter receptor subunit TctC